MSVIRVLLGDSRGWSILTLAVALSACTQTDPLVGTWKIELVTDDVWVPWVNGSFACEVTAVTLELREDQTFEDVRVATDALPVKDVCTRWPDTVVTTSTTGIWTRAQMGPEEAPHLVRSTERTVIETDLPDEELSIYTDDTTSEVWTAIDMGKDDLGRWLWFGGVGILRRAEK